MTNMLNDVLMQAVDRMPKMAEHVYAVTLKQTVVDAWSYIAVILIVTAIFGAVLKYSYDKRIEYQNNERNSYYGFGDCPWDIVLVIVGVVATCLSIIGIIGLRDCICMIINPEYAVLQKLISLVK